MKSFFFFTRKSISLFSFLFLFFTFLNAQDDKNDKDDANVVKPKSEFWKKVRFGGGVTGGLTTGGFSLGLSPTAAYQFNPKASLGIGLNGLYSSTKTFKSIVWGGSLIGLYNPIQAIQLSAELEELNVNRTFENITPTKEDPSGVLKQNYWYPALFLGAGYRIKNASVGIRYDVFYDEETSIFSNAWVPFVRVSF